MVKVNSRVGIRGLRLHSDQMPSRSKEPAAHIHWSYSARVSLAVSQVRQSLVQFSALPQVLPKTVQIKPKKKHTSPYSAPAFLLGVYSVKITLQAWWKRWPQTTACPRSETFRRMLNRNHGGAAPAHSVRMRRRGWRSLMIVTYWVETPLLGECTLCVNGGLFALRGEMSLDKLHQNLTWL